MASPDLSEILRRHFMPSFEMLEEIIEKCPENLWTNSAEEPPVWLQLYHVLFGLQVWFGDTKEYSYPDFGKQVTPDFGAEQQDSLSRDEMADYANTIQQQTQEFFDKISGANLLAASVIHDRFTNMDTALEQIRHIIYHVARINGIFKKHYISPVGYKYFY